MENHDATGRRPGVSRIHLGAVIEPVGDSPDNGCSGEKLRMFPTVNDQGGVGCSPTTDDNKIDVIQADDTTVLDRNTAAICSPTTDDTTVQNGGMTGMGSDWHERFADEHMAEFPLVHDEVGAGAHDQSAAAMQNRELVDA